ncbi:hypothetical protein PSCICJ_04350 [Pseudomonas cichorii]|nr:hypothetical protein PSCICJ_04350 [Pseudomonas cichorii]
MARIEVLLQLPDYVPVGRVQNDFIEPQPGLLPDHLHGLVEPFPDDGSAQDVVTIDDALQRLGKTFQLLWALCTENSVQDIRIALGGGNMVVENTFLQRRQRIDILHVCGTARHGFDDPVNRVLAQSGQGQHVRRDAEGRAQPVTTVSLHQIDQRMLVQSHAVYQRIIESLVIAQNDKVTFLVLESDRVTGNDSHQFVEEHRITCAV